MNRESKVVIVGAGPVGCLVAIMLAHRGCRVEVFEKRPDLREISLEAGRSINLVLTLRGLEALERIDAREEVLEITVPVVGRMMHDQEGNLVSQPYGQDESERNYSVSRSDLNRYLLNRAEEAGVSFGFQTSVESLDLESRTLVVDGKKHSYEILIGADGAPSVVRQALEKAGHIEAQVEMMSTAYKELYFPAKAEGGYAIDGSHLHIWPRGHHFLMALANLDGSFTGTLYLPAKGDLSFESLSSKEAVQSYFEEFYPDSREYLGDFESQLVENPVGNLGTVRTAPWYYGDEVLLIGDSAHGIVPFFGQGLNSGFEDCRVLLELFDEQGGEGLFQRFFQARKRNTDAIADMALENFVEMSEKVGDPKFLLRKKTEARLAEDPRFPYWSRYRMVMYTHLPYGDAYRLGEKQQAFLSELIEGVERPEEVDMEAAARLFERDLAEDYKRYFRN